VKSFNKNQEYLTVIGVGGDFDEEVKNEEKCVFCCRNIGGMPAGYISYISYTPVLQAVHTSTYLHQQEDRIVSDVPWWVQQQIVEKARLKHVENETKRMNTVANSREQKSKDNNQAYDKTLFDDGDDDDSVLSTDITDIEKEIEAALQSSGEENEKFEEADDLIALTSLEEEEEIDEGQMVDAVDFSEKNVNEKYSILNILLTQFRYGRVPPALAYHYEINRLRPLGLSRVIYFILFF
jgi:hypothetical protein